MASILDRYGIKEVADVVFYAINQDGTPGNPVLFLDTLKVSTIEQTAETVYAQGGKGNPRLIGWDFGKEITLSLEDALFSPKSMAVMFGNGTVANTTAGATVKKTIAFSGTTKPTEWEDANGVKHAIPTEAKAYDEVGNEAKTFDAGKKYFLTFDIPVAGQEIVVGPNTFPGSYYLTGDTYARSEVTGKDEYFQFIVPKGKVTSENTITMEAEGDPSVFNMTIDVLRATENGKPVMMMLVKYSLDDDKDGIANEEEVEE